MKPMYCVCLLVLLAGCKHGPVTKLHAAPAPKLDPGWVNHDTKYGFSMAAPSDWKLNPPSLLTLNLQGMANTNAPEPPDTLDPADAAKQEKDGILLQLFPNVKPTIGEALSRCFVKKTPVSGTLEETAKDLKSNLGNADMKMEQLPIGPCAVFKGTSTTVGGDTVEDLIYLVVNGDDGYRFQWETTNSAVAIDQAAPPMMETLRFK